MTSTRLKTMAKEVLYRAGGLGAVHHIRNRDTLTILMFHRVIEPGSPAWSGANPLFTVSRAFFECMLKFIRRHYNTVDLAAVARARRGEVDLPRRALLISFDDGWADNVEFAAPALKAAGIPAVFFVATGAVERGEAFWQERLFAAAVDQGPQGEVWKSVTPSGAESSNFQLQVMKMISQLEQQGPAAGPRLLQNFLAAGDCLMPQMMTPDDITRLAEEPLFDFGTHGVTHTPFSDLDNPLEELACSWKELSRWCAPPVQSLSFPHGRYTPDILALAKSSGYELIFDSDKTLCPAGQPFVAPTFGRFEIRPPGSDPSRSDFGGRKQDDFDSGRIASEMFLRPICPTTASLSRPGSEF